MNLTDEQVAAVRYCIADTIRRRRLGNIPIPQWLRDLSIAVSSRGPEYQPAQPHSKGQLISSAQAAKLLGCSRRHVSRIATDLDGQLVAGRWMFHRAAVAEYADAKGHLNDGEGS